MKKKDLLLVKCSSCGLVFVLGAPKDFSAQDYNYYSGRRKLPVEKIYNPITGKRYDALLDKLKVFRKTNSILDIGCGEGHFISVAGKRGWNALGLEMSPQAVEVCDKLGLKVKKAELLNLQIQEGQFDAVFMFEVLEHLTQPKEYLMKIRGALRDGGALFITTPNFNSITRQLLMERWGLISREHLFYFTRKSLLNLLNECDFKILEFGIKNICLPELRRVFKKDIKRTFTSNQDLRKAIEKNKYLYFVKELVNRILNFTGTGETMELLCQKAG